MKTLVSENFFISYWLKASPQGSGGEPPGTNFQASPAIQLGKKEVDRVRHTTKRLCQLIQPLLTDPKLELQGTGTIKSRITTLAHTAPNTAGK